MAVPYSRMLFGLVPWYSFLIVLGAALAIFLAVREEKLSGLPKDTVIDLALWLLPAGILGARLYYVVFSWDQFHDDPVSALYIWEGGIAIFGAVIAGFLVVVLFCCRRRLPILRVCDVLVPGLVLAQAIGRWGNYFNMEAYGEPITNPAFQFFPLGVLISDSGKPVWHMATFFYESVWDFAVFLILLASRRRCRAVSGITFFMYLFLYSAGRLVIEDFRMDSLYASGSLRASQLLSLLLCAAVLVLFLIRLRRTSGGCPPWLSALLVPDGLFAVAVLLYCVRLPALCFSAISARLAFLGGFSALSLLVLFLLYRLLMNAEVPDAHD